MEKENKLRKNLLKTIRIQMYLVLSRLAFTIFSLVVLIIATVNGIQTNSHMTGFAIFAIIIMNIIAIAAYHHAMDSTQKHYEELDLLIKKLQSKSDTNVT